MALGAVSRDYGTWWVNYSLANWLVGDRNSGTRLAGAERWIAGQAGFGSLAREGWVGARWSDRLTLLYCLGGRVASSSTTRCCCRAVQATATTPIFAQRNRYPGGLPSWVSILSEALRLFGNRWMCNERGTYSISTTGLLPRTAHA